MSDAVTILPAVLSVSETALYLSVSPDTVRRLIRDGSMPHARVGNSIRIHKKDLDTYLADRRTTKWERVDGRGQRILS